MNRFFLSALGGSARATLGGFSLNWCIVLIITTLGLFAVEASGSNGDRLTLPPALQGKPTFAKQSGLQIRVDSTWVGSRGYRPVKVTATSAAAVTADTTITISFRVSSWRRHHREMRVEYEFELPQGTTSATATFLVPQYNDWNSQGWDIWVDGVKEEQLSVPLAPFNAGTSNTLNVGYLTPNPEREPTQILEALSNGALDWQPLGTTKPVDSWIDYTSLDLIEARLESLQIVQKSTPEKLAKLLRWVRAGGNLWVFHIGQDFSQLPQLEKLLSAKRDQLPTSASSLSQWHFLPLGSSGRQRQEMVTALTMQDPDRISALSTKEILASPRPNQAVDSRHWCIARSFGLGTVVAIQGLDDRRRRDASDLASVLQQTSLAENLDWSTRHGNDPAGGNPDFNNWLIPAVGAAPVFEFQLLITLFVIGIGPLNYWLLKRRNQLPVLLITVPVAALVATLMLFTYGFFADGIGRRVRVRSLTMLDQQTEEVACWARLSYYAGIAPSGGLQMPLDTAVYPILPAQSRLNRFGSRHANQQRDLLWQQQQRLTRGWLGSRTPTQYLALTARVTKKQLQFDQQQAAVRVTNHLGTEVLALVMQDHAGNIYLGNQIAAEGTANLTPSTYLKAASQLRKWLTENLPQLPDGYIESKNFRRRNYNTPSSDSLMELHLEAFVSPTAQGWGPGTYVAITATGIEVPLGIEDAVETNSFHVVRGTW